MRGKKSIQKAIEKILPFPEILPQLSRSVKEMEPVSKIAEIIKQDPSLSADVIRIANTPFYRRIAPVDSIEGAIKHLGSRNIMKICTTAALCQAVQEPLSPYNLETSQYLKHCIATAYCAQIFSTVHRLRKQYTAYTCGLLHDIGKVVLSNYDKDIKLNGTSPSLLDAEKEKFGLDHTEAGLKLAQHWKMPKIIQLVIRHHHTPLQTRDNRHLVSIVYASNKIAAVAGYPAGAEYSENDVLADPIIGQLGITPDTLDKMVKILAENVEI